MEDSPSVPPFHFHVRVTPHPTNLPAMTPDMSGMLTRWNDYKYILAHEVSEDGIPHYHLYVEGPYVAEKTVRNAITAYGIPKTGRGRANAYYALKYNEYTNPSPEYVCAEGDIRAVRGYSDEEVAKHIEQGRIKYSERKKSPTGRVEIVAPTDKTPKESYLDDLWLKFMDEVIPKDLAIKGLSYTIGMFRASTLTWFRDRGNGRFNLNVYKQFLVCGWLQVDMIRRRDINLTAEPLEKYGV